jgi:hypothetical protein
MLLSLLCYHLSFAHSKSKVKREKERGEKVHRFDGCIMLISKKSFIAAYELMRQTCNVCEDNAGKIVAARIFSSFLKRALIKIKMRNFEINFMLSS